LAIAEHFAAHAPESYSVLLLEKNAAIGQETSSRNSEVIHAGIYYAPGSLRARLCLEGKELLLDYCQRYGVPHRQLGKLIVAQAGELASLETIQRNAEQCGVHDLVHLSHGQLAALEPSVSASEALFSPSTGIVDSHAFMDSLWTRASAMGVEFGFLSHVQRVSQREGKLQVDVLCGQAPATEAFSFTCGSLINAGGLHAQALAQKIEGLDAASIPTLHLSRGHYFALSGKSPFSHLVYPVPERHHQGLGVHATLDMGGQLRFGPDVEYIDAIDYSIAPGRKEHFVEAIQRYYPGLQAERLLPAYAGIRPRLSAQGEPSKDFAIQTQAEHGVPGLVQLFGIDSPGLTASLSISKELFRLINP
jgi:L-2-hydroxyglutarate oxidase LhgO